MVCFYYFEKSDVIWDILQKYQYPAWAFWKGQCLWYVINVYAFPMISFCELALIEKGNGTYLLITFNSQLSIGLKDCRVLVICLLLHIIKTGHSFRHFSLKVYAWTWRDRNCPFNGRISRAGVDLFYRFLSSHASIKTLNNIIQRPNEARKPAWLVWFGYKTDVRKHAPLLNLITIQWTELEGCYAFYSGTISIKLSS